MWCPGSVMVLDCINSRSLPSYLLSKGSIAVGYSYFLSVTFKYIKVMILFYAIFFIFFYIWGLVICFVFVFYSLKVRKTAKIRNQ